MSGHSKWHNIKHKKAMIDTRRGKLFTKLARAIAVAAKEGGGDPDGNAALATAIQKAKDVSMPKDNIERAIAKGTGAGADADAFESIDLRGLRRRAASRCWSRCSPTTATARAAEVRHAFSKHGGSLGEPAPVAWHVREEGRAGRRRHAYTEDDLMAAIDAGAEDVAQDDTIWEIVTEPGDLQAVRAALEAEGVELQSADLTMRASTTIEIDESTATKVFKLVDALDDNDDVNAVHANFDVDSEVLERVAG